MANAIPGTGPLTVEAWVRPATNFANAILVANAGNNTGWSLELNNGQLTLWVSTNLGWQFSRYATALSAGQWYHVAGTYGGGQARVFVNGVASAATNVGTLTQGTTFRIGGLTGFPYFNGLVDEVRVSNVARYAANFSVPGAPFAGDANTLALWSFDEGAGQTTADESPSANTGTLGSTAGADSNDPAWVAGYPFP